MGKKKFTGAIAIHYAFSLSSKIDLSISKKFSDALDNSGLVVARTFIDDNHNIEIRPKTEYIDGINEAEFNTSTELFSCFKKSFDEDGIESNLIIDKDEDNSISDTKSNDFVINVGIHDDKLRMTIDDIRKVQLYSDINSDEYIEAMKLKLYGEEYFGARTHFHLIPFRISKDVNSKPITVTMNLDLFNSSVCVIKCVAFLVDQPLEYLASIDLTKMYPIIEPPDGLEAVENCNSVYDVIKCYVHNICTITGTGSELYLLDKPLQHVVITKSDLHIKSFNGMSNKTKQYLFKLVNAPYPHSSTLKADTIDFFNYNTFGKDYIRTFVSSVGKIITITEESKLSCFDSVESFSLNAIADREFVIQVCLLDKLNNKQTYDMLNSDRNVNVVIDRYKNIENNILDLCESDFGSVNEELLFFKSRMKYYLKEDIYARKILNAETVIKSESENHIKKLSFYFTIIMTFFTMIFGLPLINNTLKIILGSDVRAFSIMLWGIICIIMSLLIIIKHYKHE